MSALLAGASISLRESHLETLLARPPQLPFIEVLADNFLALRGPHYAKLRALAERYPVLLHCVGFSIGSDTPLETDYLARVARMARELNAVTVSDHLSLSQTPHGFVHDLLPLNYQKRFLPGLVAKVAALQAALPVPLLLENVSRYLRYPDDELEEGALCQELVAQTGVGLLLDVNNLYVTAHNLESDPYTLLASYPLSAVRQYHLAGHHQNAPLLVDSHGAEVAEPVWVLYRHCLKTVGCHPTIIEWDNNLPPLPRLLDEAQRAQRWLLQAQVVA
ncbi:DUF692 domain-containing protein [Ferrimonas balearica]|uniref:DUF692 domain-containing protein n=1 Tax=Ferrimonas balearica TaxID=44012 RepID=UPI001C991D0B|nr:DUF692 domain-containing protein [Ferrimonas balearica]MBY5990614.1 DUF692 domain-containing protein [Ferrimonas balearica]